MPKYQSEHKNKLALFSISWRTILLFTIFSVLVSSFASAETVKLQMQANKDGTEIVPIESTNSVSAIFVNGEKYFDYAEFENLSYNYFENAIVFGDFKSNQYPKGYMNLRLTSWFKSKVIKKVSITGFSLSTPAVYLYVNGTKSDESLPDIEGTISSTINQSCENLEIKLSYTEPENLKRDSRAVVDYVIIEYDTPVVVNPSVGVKDIEVGQLVTLDNCVIEADGTDYVAHVVKTANGMPVVVNGQSDTYQIPVVWPEDVEKPQTGALVKVTGEIIDNGASKAIQILSTTQLEPIYSHLPPNVLINGAQLENNVIKADDRIEFSHQYGENVKIYYVKRRGEKIDPANAKVDPALINSENASAEQASNTHYSSGNAVDESGTFEYTGPFQLVHKDNLKTTTNNDLVLILQVHSSPDLTAGASWTPSEEFSLRNEMTTELLDILVGKDTKEIYHDFLGRPVVHPKEGQLLIRTCSGKSEIIKY